MRRLILSVTLPLLALGLVPTAQAASTPPSPGQELVIFDNDWCDLTPLAPLLAAPNIKLLGLTTVTGDCWRDEATLAALADLETLGHSEIPVASGAVFPLINTAERMAAWERANGALPWKGAWNAADASGRHHPETPNQFGLSGPLPVKAKALDESAAAFLIRQVRAHPHQVTIYAAGPMTNIALAIRLDPDFARLAKAFVFDGGHIQSLNTAGESDADFNLAFDPEAAHIALTAPWARVSSIGDIADSVPLTPELQAKIAAESTPLSAYVLRKVEIGMPIWDAIGAAIVAEPSLVTRSLDVAMDVDIEQGLHYGRVRVWTAGRQPALGARQVTIIQAIDTARFIDRFVAATHDKRADRP